MRRVHRQDALHLLQDGAGPERGAGRAPGRGHQHDPHSAIVQTGASREPGLRRLIEGRAPERVGGGRHHGGVHADRRRAHHPERQQQQAGPAAGGGKEGDGRGQPSQQPAQTQQRDRHRAQSLRHRNHGPGASHYRQDQHQVGRGQAQQESRMERQALHREVPPIPERVSRRCRLVHELVMHEQAGHQAAHRRQPRPARHHPLPPSPRDTHQRRADQQRDPHQRDTPPEWHQLPALNDGDERPHRRRQRHDTRHPHPSRLGLPIEHPGPASGPGEIQGPARPKPAADPGEQHREAEGQDLTEAFGPCNQMPDLLRPDECHDPHDGKQRRNARVPCSGSPGGGGEQKKDSHEAAHRQHPDR